MISLIDVKKFTAQLSAAKKDRMALVDAVKQARSQALDAAQKALTGKKFNGDQCARALSDTHDVILSELFKLITQDIFPCANPTKTEKITLIAIGGYGRRRLAPFSDIDLLFLLPYKPTPWSEQSIEYMLKILWDSGMKIGHATRSVKNTASAAASDMTICTALLDARPLAGDADLHQEFQKHFARVRRRITARKFVKAKLEERDQRHRRAGQSRYLVEPDIKNSKGGLRDLQTLWWLANFCYGARSGEDLLESGLFTKAEYNQLHACEAMLWEIRCHLHFLCDQAQEHLSFQLQPSLADRMGYRDTAGMIAAEHFMKAYFRIAKQAGGLTRILCAVLEERAAKPHPRLSRFINRARQLSRGRNKSGFIIESGRLKINRKDFFAKKPSNLLQFFSIAAEHDLMFHPEALNQVRGALKYITPQLRRDKTVNRLFLDILSSRKNPARILRTMNEAGLLGRFIPDFGRIVAQMQFNMYHHYTVDEHLIHAVGQLADIERHGLENMKLAAKIFRQIGRQTQMRQILYVSVFTHDIAKGRKGDHSQEGAKIARALAVRLGLEEKNAAIAEWLVGAHLLMSDVAQKRDLADPQTIRNFVAQVKTHDRLNLLFALTIADIRAVGEGVWNGWKAQLLETLYKLADEELNRAHHHYPRAQTVRQARQKFAHQLEEWPERQRRDYMRLHSDAYWLNVDDETKIRHAGLWREWNEETPFMFSADDMPSRAASRVIFIAQDHPGLFARLVGAFAMNGLHVTDARIFTARNGLAFDTFWVQTAEGKPIGDQSRVDRIGSSVARVLTGAVRQSDMASKKENGKIPANVFHIKPNIFIDNKASDRHTVIEVDCLDQAGLLHALAQRIFRQGLILSSAHIATFGERAVDVFYVKDSTGQKIINPARQKSIRAGLIKTIAA